MNKKKRIFVGYQLSEELQQEIGEWRENFLDLPVRWTPLDFLHVTLVPPWYEENVERVVHLLQTSFIPVKQVPVTFETINLGPDSVRPWLIWAKGQMPQKLFTLRMHLLEMLQRVERRDPVLHTTLARFTQKQFELFPKKHFLENIKWEERISSFSLIASHLKPTGAEYETLTKIQL